MLRRVASSGLFAFGLSYAFNTRKYDASFCCPSCAVAGYTSNEINSEENER